MLLCKYSKICTNYCYSQHFLSIYITQRQVITNKETLWIQRVWIWNLCIFINVNKLKKIVWFYTHQKQPAPKTAISLLMSSLFLLIQSKKSSNLSEPFLYFYTNWKAVSSFTSPITKVLWVLPITFIVVSLFTIKSLYSSIFSKDILIM